MSKELPYFRFTAFQWLNDDISLEEYPIKGLFIDVCAYYWFKDCSITKAMLEKRFSNALTGLKSLLDSGIIKLRENSDFIDISFLNEQFDELSELRKVRQEAGSKGGKQRASKAKAKLKQKPSYKDKDKDKDKDKSEESQEISFKSEVWHFTDKYPEPLLKAFLNYWTEKDAKGKMRFQSEKYFEVSRRLATWASRDKTFTPEAKIVIPHFEYGPKE